MAKGAGPIMCKGASRLINNRGHVIVLTFAF